MRWLTFLVLALGLGACSQATSLDNQLSGMFSNGTGVAYDVRSVSSSTYDATCAYTAARSNEKVQIARNLLYRGLTHVKKDGYDFVVVQGPYSATLTHRQMQYGREMWRQDYPGLKYSLIGYKSGSGEKPAKAVSTDSLLAQLAPQVTDK